MAWRFAYASERKRVALLASRDDHCLLDLLWRRRRGELDADVVAVVSNHPDHAGDVGGFGVPFHHVAVAPGSRGEAEERMLELLAGNVDLVVLARYMQILSGSFLERLGVPVINIHHSFLPAFVGADPYRRARDRGVKIIGATAHYVTEHSTPARSSSRTSRASRTARPSSNSSGSAATSSAWCSHAPCVAPRGPRPRAREPHGCLLTSRRRVRSSTRSIS